MSLIGQYIAAAQHSALREFIQKEPWELTSDSTAVVGRLLSQLGEDYLVTAGVALHVSVNLEAGAIVKGPAIVGPNSCIAAGAYIRGGCWLDANCTLGPGVELKSSFVFSGSRLAHFNFVGDSVLGSGVNLEAGAVIANYRNESHHLPISFHHSAAVIETGVTKFGALVGDHTSIGANAVVAPGAILARGSAVPRLGLIDQGVRVPR